MITKKNHLIKKVNTLLEHCNEHYRDKAMFERYMKAALEEMIRGGEIKRFKVKWFEPVKPDKHVPFRVDIWYGEDKSLSFTSFTHVKA